MLNRIFTALLMLVNVATYGQWTDNFTDSNFTQAPEWMGEATKFEITAEVLHLNDVAATGAAYLSTPSDVVANATWEFYVEISENPSSSNFARVYLMADQADGSSHLNGYFVMIGGSKDEISLYRQDGSNTTKIIDGTDGRSDTSLVQMTVRVTRDARGEWQLFSRSADETTFVAEGTVQDEAHTVSHYFGVYCQYTSTRKDAFYFDDFVVTGIPQPDTTPPTITGLSILSATQLQLMFSEALDAASSQILSHYDLSSHAISNVQTPDAQTVILTWNKLLTNGTLYELRVNTTQDEAGNVVADTTLQFRYFVATATQWQDVIINEWMPDPNPVVADLPEAEFIELYNRSDHPFQLQDWTLNGKSLPNYMLLPGQLLILSPDSYAADFAQYGEVLALVSWPTLPNGGSNLVLKDASGETIDSLSYAEDGVAGGYAIERIRPDSPCDQRLNYGASLNARGGTPGRQNSLLIDQPDTQPPALLRVVATGSRTVQLHFDESVSPADVRVTLSPAVGVAHVQPDTTDEKILILTLTGDLTSGATYAVTAQHARDCYGHEALSLTDHFYYDNRPPAIERVILRDTAALQIVFDEPLVAAGAEEAYSVDHGVGEARSVAWLSDSASIVVHFSASLDDGLIHRLRVAGPTDRYGNSTDSLVHDFMFRNDIDTVRIVSAYQVNVAFSTLPLPTSALSVENYQIDRGLGHPNVAVLLSPHEVQLIYDHPLSANKAHELLTENLVDADGFSLNTPVYRFTYDQKSSVLDSVVALDERTLVAHFSEQMIGETGSLPTSFVVNQSIGSPEQAELLPGGQSFKLYLSSSLTQETTYELSVIGLADRSGNVITSMKKKAFYYDQRPPSLRHWQLISPNQLHLEFHEPLAAASAYDPQQYRLGADIHPDSVTISTIHPEQMTLSFTHPFPEAITTLQITQVADHYGNTPDNPIEITINHQLPAVGRMVPLSATELRLDFTKPVDAAVMEQLANYRLDSLTSPVQAVVDKASRTSVTLRWPDPLTAGSKHTVLIHRITAQSGTTTQEVAAPFTYDTQIANIAVDGSGLTVAFTVPVDRTKATDVSHYTVTAMGTPVRAIPVDPRTVRLVFAQPFAEQALHTLTLHGLLDQDNTLIPASQHTIGRGRPPGYHQLLITELMADPSPVVGLPEVEYIELFNASDQLISTQDVRFSDASTTIILPTTLLAPHEYVILCNASHQAALTYYGRTIPVNHLPSLNGTGDSLCLTDAYGQAIFSVVYSQDWYNDAEKRNGGWSLEMVDAQRPCGEQDNWTASVDPKGGTPGQANSVQQTNPDQFGPEVLRAFALNDTVVHVLFNEKLNALSTRSAKVQLSDALTIRTLQWLPACKEAIITLNQSLQTGHRYSVSVVGVTDCSGNLMGTAGNTAPFVLPEPAAAGDVLLSELLFRPRSGGEKFVELYNHSTKQIDIQGWYLANVVGDSLINRAVITDDHHLLAPGKYVALTEHPATLKADYPASPEAHLLAVAALPSLPAEEGTVVLLNPAQAIMQQFHYSDRYHHPLLDNTSGVALERIAWNSPVDHPATWQSAAQTVGYATPGYRNSQPTGLLTPRATLSVDPPVFAPGYPGRASYTRIHYQFDQPGTVANVMIYDARGRKVRDLGRNTTLAEAGFLVWDGTNDYRQRVGMGYYLIFFEVFDTQGRVNVFKEKVVVGGL